MVWNRRRMFSLALLTTILIYGSPARSQWGVEAGASYDILSGSFRAPCGCIFQAGNGIWNGKGVGFSGSIFYDILSLNEFTIGAAAGYDQKDYTAYEVPSDPQSGDEFDAQMRYVTLKPYVRYRITGTELFVQAAPEAEYLLSNSYQHTSHPIPDPSVDKDSTMGDLRSMRYAALVSVGYKFNAFGVELAPMLTADFPLNNIREDATLNPVLDSGIHGASGWHLTSLDLSVAILFK